MTQTPGSARQIDLNRPEATEAVDRMFNHPSMDIALMTYDAHPEVLNDAAAAWHAASTRLAAFADTVRQKAAAAATAWSGTQASVGFQRDLKRLHDTVRGLAEASAGMQRMVESSAQMLSSFKDAFPYDHVPFMGNDMVDEMMNGLFRLLTDSYAQAIQDHGPTHLTTDYPRVGQTGDQTKLDSRDEGRSTGGGLAAGYGRGNGLSGLQASNSTPLTPLPSGPDRSHDPLFSSATPSSLSDGVYPSGFGDDLGPAGDSVPDGTTQVGGPGWQFDEPDPGTSLAGYDSGGIGPASFGDAGAGGLSGSGFGTGSGAGVGAGAGPSGGLPGFGSSGSVGRVGQPGAGMGMMPPGAGNTDDEDEERNRASWLPEDTDVWGAKDVEASPPVLGATEPERPRRGRRLRDVADS